MPNWHKTPTSPSTCPLRSTEYQIILCSHLTYASAAAPGHQSVCAYVSVQYCLSQQSQVVQMNRCAISLFSFLKDCFLLSHSRLCKGSCDPVLVLHRVLLREGHGISGYEKMRMPGAPRATSPLSVFSLNADGLAVTLKPSEIHSKGCTWKYSKELDSIAVFKLDGWNRLHALFQVQGKVNRPKYWWIFPFTINRDLWNALVCPVTVNLLK